MKAHKSNKWQRSAWAVAWCGAAMAVQAQTVTAPSGAPVVSEAASPAAMPQQPVAWEEYLRMVLRNNPSLAADRLEVGLARADTRTAGAFPNPTASYSNKPGEKSLGIDQPIPIFGQRRQRIATAHQGEVTAAAHVDQAVASALNDAAQAFNDLLIAQQRLVVWQDSQVALDKASVIVTGQMEAGARSRYDGARVNLQKAQMAMQVAKAEAAMHEASGKVAALAALPHWHARAVGSLQALSSDALPSFDTLWEQAQRQLPSVRAAQAELDLARSKVDLAKREALPTPSVGVARVKSRYDGQYTQWGVSVEIPLFDRHQGTIDRAAMEAEQAQLRWDAAMQSARSDLKRALQQLTLKRAGILAYEKEGMAQIDPLRQMSNDAYRLGKGSILELVDALGSIAEHRLEHLELAKDYLDAEWQMRVASGQLPQVQP